MVLEELDKYEKEQEEIVKNSKVGKSKLRDTKSIEKMLDYVQCFSKGASTTVSTRRTRPLSSYTVQQKHHQKKALMQQQMKAT